MDDRSVSLGGAQLTGGSPVLVSHRIVLGIALPVTLSSLSTPLVGAVDTAVIGQLGDPELMGGVAVASILVGIVLLPFNFVGKVTTGLAAQAVGAGDPEEVLATVIRAIGLALAIGVLLVLSQVLIEQIGFFALGIEGEVRDAARTYFRIRIWSAPFVLMNFAVLGWLFGRGSIGRGFALQLFLNGFNIVVTVVLVLHFEWGVAGAATATVAAELSTTAIGAALILNALSRRRAGHRIRVIDRLRLRSLLSMNVDMIVRTLTVFLVMAFVTRQGATLGTVTLAANAILLNLVMVCSAMMNGLAVAAQQLGGRSLGGLHFRTFKYVVRLTWRWSLAEGLALTALLFLFREPIVDLMTTDESVRETAQLFFPYGAAAPAVGALAYQMDGVFIGGTWAREMRNMMLVAAAIFIVSWFALRSFGNHGLWLSFLIFLAARGLTLRWRMDRILPEGRHLS